MFSYVHTRLVYLCNRLYTSLFYRIMMVKVPTSTLRFWTDWMMVRPSQIPKPISKQMDFKACVRHTWLRAWVISLSLSLRPPSLSIPLYLTDWLTGSDGEIRDWTGQPLWKWGLVFKESARPVLIKGPDFPPPAKPFPSGLTVTQIWPSSWRDPHIGAQWFFFRNACVFLEDEGREHRGVPGFRLSRHYWTW